MRVKTIGIKRYGPIPRMDLDLGSGVQPICGPNESGKTLLIDALVKMLAGRSGKLPKLLDRIDESPEGYVVLEDDGEEIVLDGGQSLSDHLGVTAGELMNIFVVRDSNLTITEEDAFYERVTDRISGLKVQDIRNVMDALKERGRLTDSGRLSDSAANDYAKSQLDTATELEKDIEKFVNHARGQGIDRLEAEILVAGAERKEVVEELDDLEKAREVDECRKLRSAYDSALDELSELQEIPKVLESIRNRLAALDSSQRGLDDLKRKESLYRRLCYSIPPSAAAIYLVSTISGLSGLTGMLLPIGMILLFILVLFLWVGVSHELSSFEKDRRNLIVEAQNAGIQARDLAELRSMITEAEGKRSKREAVLNQQLGTIKSILDIDLEGPEEVLESCRHELELREREVDPEFDLEYDAESEREARERLRSLEEKLKHLNKSHQKHHGEMRELLRRARKLDFKAFLGSELRTESENIETLKRVKDEVHRLVEGIKSDAELSRKALEIFNELDSEEQSKIEDLFGKDSPVSEAFSEITQGRYRKVEYDTDSRGIRVERDNGLTFTVEKLSKGTRDQLYLAIRVALGERLLEGKTGFFVMDDAFLSSDSDRQGTEIEMIRTLCEKGWQVIYSTAREEVAERLEQVSRNPAIGLASLS